MQAKTVWWGLLIVCTLEVLSQTYGQKYGSKDLSAVIYLLAGIAVGVLPLLKHRGRLRAVPETSSVWRYVAFGLLTVGIFYFGCQAIAARPLDYTFADMLPIIQVMGERWLAGEAVYAPIPEIWEGMQPIYLPVLWLAYVPALWLGVDMRVVNLLFLLVAGALAVRFWRPRVTVLRWWIYLPLLILLSYILVDYTTFITISEEPIVMGCYALLGYGVYRSRPAWILLALTACMLSRYAMIFWAITYISYLFWQKDRKQATWIALGSALLGLLLMYVSQGIYELKLFYSLKEAYLDSFTPELAWRTENTVSHNIGLARFVAFEQLIVLHRAVFWGSLVLPPLLYVWYHLRLRKRVAFGLFALCSLKLSLVYFYNLNALPYSYLFYTSTFMSLLVLGAFLVENGTEE